MENLLKRHFWVFNLVGLIVIAWLLAGSINGLIAMQLAAATRAPLTVSGHADGLTDLERKLKNSRASRGSGGMMAARSPFLIDEMEIEEEAPIEEEVPTEEELGEGELDASYEVTTLPVKLLGTMVVWPSKYSSASMMLKRNDQKIVTVGLELLEGQATVWEIHRTYVVLKESSKLTIAPLWKRPKSAKNAAANKETPGPRKTARAAKPYTRAPQSANGVRRISETSFQLERQMLNRKLKNLASLGQQARVVPNYHNGRYDGFRMIGMRGNSLFRDIGFTNGDIVKVINGSRIDSPNKALALYDALKNKSRLTVQIERNGMLKTMRYIVR